jgi:hypothetical protein
MRSRSARCLSRTSVKPAFSRAALACGFALALGFAGEARAALTIEPVNFSRKVDATTIFYASTNADGTSNAFATGTADMPFMDTGSDFSYAVVDLGARQGNGTPLSFNVTTTASLDAGSGNIAVLAIKVAGAATGSPTYAPIASSSQFTCSATTGPDCPTPAGATNAVNNHAVTVPFRQATATISIFPTDICVDYAAANTGQLAAGCTNVGVDPSDPTSVNSPEAMSLTWQIKFIKQSDRTVVNESVDSGELKLFFQSGAQGWSCPSDLNDRYFPGDKEIEFNAVGFQGGTTGFAPQVALFAVGKLSADGGSRPVTVRDSSFRTSNDFFTRIGFGGTEKIGRARDEVDAGGGEMLNTTNGTDNGYEIAFMVRDATGAVIPVPSQGANACSFGLVRSSDIHTFLNQSKCFIATAAFRSVDAAPVEMLRAFRDEVLLPTQWGSMFVEWYYDWSPRAAEWLMRHPRLRTPVLRLLVPVQAAAWLGLRAVEMIRG